MTDISDTLQVLCTRAKYEFDTLLDYIWKTPRLIDSELKIELEKLSEYFPLNGDPEHDRRALRLREQRWSMEAHAIFLAFPAFMSSSNFLCSVSLFEAYALLLCAEVETFTGCPMAPIKGNGRTKIFRYLQKIGVDFKALDLYEQIDAAFKFRNCQIHASGLLRWSDQAVDIRHIVSESRYLSEYHRIRTRQSQKKNGYVAIENNKLGERLLIKNDYSFLVTKYLRDYFCDLCENSAIAARSLSVGGT